MMRIKPVIWISFVLFAAMVFFPKDSRTAQTPPFPKAEIEQSAFEFPAVIAGTEVKHRFFVHNKGEAQLNIINVYSG